MKKWWFVIFCLTVFRSSEGAAFTVAPGRTEARLNPGGKIKAVLEVTNDSTERVHVAWETKDWFVLPENKTISVDQWLTVKKAPSFILKPKETGKVPIVIFCPKDTQGELVGMVSFAFQGDHPMNVLPVISVSVYVEAIGHTKVAGKITDLAIRRWQDRTQVAVAVLGTGNVHLRPTGSVTLFDASGKQVADLEIKEGEPAYPKHERGYFAEDKTLKLDKGHYLAKVELIYRDLVLRATRQFDVSKDASIQMLKGLETQYSSDFGDSTDTVKGAAKLQ